MAMEDRDHEREEAARPLVEAGQGEAEGFEEAERELIEHASHGDEHSPFKVIEDASDEDEDDRGRGGAEADRERSSERQDDEI